MTNSPSGSTPLVPPRDDRLDIPNAGVQVERISRDARYIPTLDGWRAVAITLVLIGHASPSVSEAWGAAVAKPFTMLGGQGRTGVNIFFGISGFLICSRLLHEYRSRGHLQLRRFYIRRAHRILPPLIVCLTGIGLLAVSGVIVVSLKDYLAALLVAANYSSPSSWYVEHFWSLAMEEHFYLIFPILLAGAGVRRALWMTGALAVAVIAWRAVDITFHVTPTLRANPWLRTDTACDGLLWGCFAALVYDQPEWRERLRRWFHPLVFLLMLIAFVLVARREPATSAEALVNLTLQLMLIPALLVATLSHPGSLISRLLELSGLRWIGRISYSLYLWQQLFLAWQGSRAPQLAIVQSWPINLICVFAVAAASYYLIERPFIREGYRVTAPGKLPRGTGG